MANVNTGLVYFDSARNYQKIIQQGDQAVSVADPNASTLVTVTHNLDHHPAVRVWYENLSGHICEATNYAVTFAFSSVSSDFTNHVCYYLIYTDKIEIYFDRAVTTGTTRTSRVYWRIYADAA